MSSQAMEVALESLRCAFMFLHTLDPDNFTKLINQVYRDVMNMESSSSARSDQPSQPHQHKKTTSWQEPEPRKRKREVSSEDEKEDDEDEVADLPSHHTEKNYGNSSNDHYYSSDEHFRKLLKKVRVNDTGLARSHGIPLSYWKGGPKVNLPSQKKARFSQKVTRIPGKTITLHTVHMDFESSNFKRTNQ